MRDLTLAERLLARVAEISRRGDVIVRVNTGSWGGRVGRWKDTLPADMLALYDRLNGFVFHYAFTDAPDDWHGFSLLALDEDGKKVIDPKSRTLSLPRQVASRFPKHFFQSDALGPDENVLLFLGDASAWGVLMLGAGESARFTRWNNDGDLDPMPDTFTAVVERLITNGFAHTWAYDNHPEAAAVRARLATPTPDRETYALEVLSREELSESDARRAMISAHRKDDVLDKLVRAFGLAKTCKDASRDEKIAAVDLVCTRPVDDKVALAAMRATGHKKPTRELFDERFLIGAGPFARLSLRLRHASGVTPVMLEEATLVRVLDTIPGVDVASSFPAPRALLQCAHHWAAIA